MIEFFEGSLDDYEKLVMEGSSAKNGAMPATVTQAAAAPKVPVATKGSNDRKEQRQQAARSREESKPLRDKARKLEQQLEREHRKLTELEQKLADPTLYDETNKGWLAKLLSE